MLDRDLDADAVGRVFKQHRGIDGLASAQAVPLVELSEDNTCEVVSTAMALVPADNRKFSRGLGTLSGALKCFLVLPLGPEDLTFELRWEQPAGTRPAENWMTVSSLGEGSGSEGDLTGTGLELRGDTYIMYGDLVERHYRDGHMSTCWLTQPGFDVQAFAAQLEKTYQVTSNAFDAPAHPYRVFVRAHPHRGANASAHPASFVMAMNPANPLEDSKLYQTIAHELVREWLHLDGPPHRHDTDGYICPV